MNHLTNIDLSQNLLITVSIDSLMGLHKLKQINLTNNPINCDESMQTLKWMKKRKINVDVKDCGKLVIIKF